MAIRTGERTKGDSIAASGRKIAAGGSPICFDELPTTAALAIYPEVPEVRGSPPWLWWTGAMTPEIVDEVIELLSKTEGSVPTIVIGGLGSYPLYMGEWPQWLVRWNRRAENHRLVVDTRDLVPRQKKRLVEGTRRAALLVSEENPVIQFVELLTDWITERLG